MAFQQAGSFGRISRSGKGTQRTNHSEREIFNLSGPSYLTDVHWENPDHRRSVAAALVQGVYVLERDRQFDRQGPEALAPPWWEFFNFELTQYLVDDVDSSTFGAIYKFKKQDLYNNVFSSENAPKYVVAFRGTINKPDSRSRDLRLDLKCILNRLDQSSRFQIAMEAIRNAIIAAGSASNIWLAGHSLGSAIALLSGKNMTRMDRPIETYLFNPPFVCIPVGWIKHPKVKHGVRYASSVVRAGLCKAVKCRSQKTLEQKDEFGLLPDWSPYMFVNPDDYICAEYIGYFERRKKMDGDGSGKIEKLGTPGSVIDIVSKVLGSDSEPFHLVPSAYLTINQTKSPDFKRAHGIHQWWNPDFNFLSTFYQFKD